MSQRHARIGNVVLGDFNGPSRDHQIQLHHVEWMPDIGAYHAYSDEFPDTPFLLIPDWSDE